MKRYTHALARRPARSLGDGLTTQALGAPDIDLALKQHDAYCAALAALGVEVIVLDADERHPDSCFVEDPAVIHDGVAVVTRPGARSRRAEIRGMREHLRELMPVVELGDDDDARLEGGDVLFCGNLVLVGQSQRTNVTGVTALTARLREIDPDLEVRGVPLSGVLHLKTGMTALSDTLLLRDPACVVTDRFDFAQTILLPREQGYAANVLPVNDGVLIATGFPRVAALAREHWSQVIELDMSEFHKMDGSLTCLSLLW